MVKKQEKRWNIIDIMSANKVLGHHFFEESTMRFFKSRVLEEVYQGKGGIYFVTSEKGPFEGAKRAYTVRVFNPKTADCGTAGEFNQLTSTKAKSAAAKLASGEFKNERN